MGTRSISPTVMCVLLLAHGAGSAAEGCTSGNGQTIAVGQCSPLGGYRCSVSGWNKVTTCGAYTGAIVVKPDVTESKGPRKNWSEALVHSSMSPNKGGAPGISSPVNPSGPIKNEPAKPVQNQK